MPQAQAMESWSPAGASVPAVVTTWATTPQPNRIRIIVPANSAQSSPTSGFFMSVSPVEWLLPGDMWHRSHTRSVVTHTSRATAQ